MRDTESTVVLRGPRFDPIPDDGRLHTIESWSLMIQWAGVGAGPHAPDAPQLARACDAESRFAIGDDGWVYHRYDYPYGWTNSGHIADYVVQAFQGWVRWVATCARVEREKCGSLT